MKDEPYKLRGSIAHARYRELLPWLANGTLAADQMAMVEQHLSECRECADELRVQRGLHDQLRDGDAVLMAPQSAWQKMAERLDREEDELAHRYAQPPRKSSGPKHTAGFWPWAVAAQVLIIVGLAAALWRHDRATELETLVPRYRTLTSAADPAIGHGLVRVVFRHDLSVSEVNALLQRLSVQIVAGPSEAGVFTLASSAENTALKTSDETTRLLTQLRGDARVLFAEPMLAAQEQR